MADAYREDLAYVHDAGFLSLAENAAPVLADALRHGSLERGLVIDLCCGSGPLSRKLSHAGYDLLGVDVSGAMISMARERVPEGCFVERSMLNLDLPPCVGVAAVGECFNYLFDDGNTEEGLWELLGRIHAALTPGGVLLFDFAEPGRANGPTKTYAKGDDWAVLATAAEDEEHKILTRRITTFRKVGEAYRRDEEVHRLRLLDRGLMIEGLRDLGFRVDVLEGYGGLTFPQGLVGLLARKE